MRGAEAIAPVVAERGVQFPVLLDPAGTLAQALGFRIVPSGFFVDADLSLRYRQVADFDLADPRLRSNLFRFAAGQELEPPGAPEQMDPRALELFAEGVSAYAAGAVDVALGRWREALAADPDNFLIRSQIWSVEHPEHFWPTVDLEWQELQLLAEGYDKPLPR